MGKRKYATVVGTGIEGLPALRQVGAREEINDLLSRGFAQVVAEVHRLDGFLTQVTSHGGIALFGVSLACEDHVMRALYAARGMQRAFGAFAAALYQSHGVRLMLRLGVHTVLAVDRSAHSCWGGVRLGLLCLVKTWYSRRAISYRLFTHGATIQRLSVRHEVRVQGCGAKIGKSSTCPHPDVGQP